MINILENFLTSYSVPTIVISIITCVFALIFEISLKDKVNKKQIIYLSILVSITMQIVYDCVILGQATVSPNTIVAGSVAGSLSIAISAFIKKVYKGENLPNSVAGLLIEELIKDYVTNEKISETALSIESLIRNENDELLENKNFTYLYITFDGSEADKLISQFGIKKDRNVFLNFSHITDFWMTSIRRSNPSNLLVLTESVLLHTLSYIPQADQNSGVLYSPEFDELIRYINSNYADKDLSLGKLADMFNFSKKYLSSLFSRNMSTKFSAYLNQVRIDHALVLSKQGTYSVKELAEKCGFSDPLYFSKVFKQIIGMSPTNYKKGVQ